MVEMRYWEILLPGNDDSRVKGSEGEREGGKGIGRELEMATLVYIWQLKTQRLIQWTGGNLFCF